MAQLKQRPGFSKRHAAGLVFLIALTLAQLHPAPASAEPEPVQLQLEVKVNGYPLDLIASFSQLADGKIASPRSELAELGIAAPGEGPDDELITLSAIPGLSYVYDDLNQAIELEVPNTSRIAKSLDSGNQGELIESSSGNGFAVNYSAYAAASYNIEDALAGLNGGSLSLDGRAFSNFGVVQQTGIIGTTTFSDMTALRLDTSWSYPDEQRMMTYRLGDIVSGGLGWSRPIRLGGAQVQRNFTLRPDLITRPLPQIAGTAAVPSTLDVYINGVKTYSSEVQEGPFKVDKLPVYTSSGTAKVVLTDSTVRETQTESEFYSAPELLRTGLIDLSVEAGFIRRDYGLESFGYADIPVLLGIMRYGISDVLNGEAHTEISEDLLMGGAGAAFNAGQFGMFSAAAAASLHDGDTGFLAFGSWEGQFGDLGLTLSTTRTFGDFTDLAAVTAVPVDGKLNTGIPEALDLISLNYAMRDIKAGVGLSFIHRLASDGERSLILGGGYSQSFASGMSVYANVFADFGDNKDYGATIGFSMPLGDTMNGSATGNAGSSGYSAVAEVSKPHSNEPLSTTWRVAHSEGENRQTTASGQVRLSKATISGYAAQQDGMARANAVIESAVVMAGGGVMLGPTIYDSFAVVDAGAEGVMVQHENRNIGKTGRNGKLLVANLQSFQKNKLAVNVDDLPLNAGIQETEIAVVPRALSGVVVNFGISKDQTAALVVLTDAAGNFIPDSSEVELEGSAEPFIVGYDGEAYVTGVGAQNRITVKYGGKECHASFAFESQADDQTRIGPLKCV